LNGASPGGERVLRRAKVLAAVFLVALILVTVGAAAISRGGAAGRVIAGMTASVAAGAAASVAAYALARAVHRRGLPGAASPVYLGVVILGIGIAAAASAVLGPPGGPVEGAAAALAGVLLAEVGRTLGSGR